jgi:FSR family fosmidomycin resistance protein-like MFS transporter
VGRHRVILAIRVLVVQVSSTYVYLSSLTSCYTFYLIDRFHDVGVEK